MERDLKEFYIRLLQHSGLGQGCGPVLMYGLVLAVMVVCLLGCKTQYVPVVEQHTEHHWNTDSVRQTDSIFNERTTLIREVDSATMAQYGIQISQVQRAFLIQTDRLQREISRLESQQRDSVHITDSVPKIVIKEVAKEPSLRERVTSLVTNAAVGALAVIILLVVIKLKRK